MPRPGPRPYECVRRAWHSDRNQPMRGSIIQQILRVVHETHSPRTKKNKEWQEKLPIVVFRAEEIMYSKANSEAEYMNLDTLWDRVNDAINTIIRRDESTETGELLPPCVEAALNLGCIPVRASRSQRHSTPRTYLTPRPPESSSLQPRIVDKCIDEQSPGLSPLHSTSQLSFVRSTTNVGSAPPVPESTCRVTGNNNLPPRDYPFLAENIPSRGNKMMKVESNIPQKPTSVYPLYYGTQYQREDPKIKKDMNSGTTFVGKPVGTSILDSSTETCVFQNLFSFPGSDTAFKRTSSPEFGQPHKRQNAAECDLSLRLGLSTDLCTSTDRGSASETEDIGSSSQELEFSGLSSQKNKSKEFCFFPEKSSIDPYGSFSKSKWFSEGECHDNRKPQAPFGDNLENLQFCYRPGFSPNWPAGPKSGPGL